MIHSGHFPYYPYPQIPQQRIVMEPVPEYVIMDVSWLDFHWPRYGFFQRFSLRSLLEIVTNVKMETDYDPAVWDAVTEVVNEEEERYLDYSSMSLLFEQIIEMFYEELNRLTFRTDSPYLFFRWVDKNAIMLKRE